MIYRILMILLGMLCLLIVVPSYSITKIFFEKEHDRVWWIFAILWMPYEYLIILPLTQIIENAH